MSASRRQVFGACSTIILSALPGWAIADADRGWARFEVGDGGVLVLAMINGVRTRAILDTGASHTVIDTRFASRAGLASASGPLNVDGWSNHATARRAAPVAIDLGAYKAVVQPLLMAFGETGPPQPVLLGRDLFTGQVLDIDFEAARWRVLPKAALQVEPGFDHVSHRIALTPATPRRGFTPNPIALRVEGYSVDARLDLGSDGPLHLSRPFVEKHGLLRGRKVSAALSGDVGGYRISPVFTCSQVELGGATLRDVPIEVFEAPSEQAVIGLPLISRFRALFDVQDEDLWVRPAAGETAAPFVKDRSGLGVLSRGGAGEVIFIAPGSPAEQAGLRVGEMIASVDGARWSGETRAWRSDAAGQWHTLGMTDGSTKRLQLADYY